MNDFLALASSIPHLSKEHVLPVSSGTPVADQPVGVVGPGAGLGVGGLIPTRAGWVPLSGEGGHATMPATTEEEDRVLARLRDRFGHVSAERVLSGPGLENLYIALAELSGAKPHSMSADAITAAGHDQLAQKTINMFCGMLGTVAGNLALTLGATGGMYLAGGILPRIRESLLISPFVDRFREKGRLSPYLQTIPVYLILSETAALLSLAKHEIL